MKKKKKKGFTKVERFLYKSSLVIIVFLVVGIVFTSTAVSKMNIELQDMNKKVEKALDTNESLAMKINEMASLDNIQSISRNLGLAYNNENIKTIYIFLNGVSGVKKIKILHNEIYEKVLNQKMSFEYIPHITLGITENEQIEFELNDKFKTIVTKVSVEEIGENEESNVLFEVDL